MASSARHYEGHIAGFACLIDWVVLEAKEGVVPREQGNGGGAKLGDGGNSGSIAHESFCVVVAHGLCDEGARDRCERHREEG